MLVEQADNENQRSRDHRSRVSTSVAFTEQHRDPSAFIYRGSVMLQLDRSPRRTSASPGAGWGPQQANRKSNQKR